MHIERISLREVGPFDDVTIEFPPGTNKDLADVYLLTGQNGTGKSTILYALAGAIAAGFQDLGDDLLTARMRSANAMVAFKSVDQRTFVAGHPDLFGSSPPSNPFDNNKALLHRRGGENLHHWVSDGGAPRYAEITQTYSNRSFSWA